MLIGKEINANTLDRFLERVVIKEGYDAVIFDKLNESDKDLMKENLLNKVINSVKEKSLNVDYSYINKTKGDIERLKNFDDLENSIAILDDLYRTDENALEGIPELKKALSNVKYYKKDFMRAFKNDNSLIVLFYKNIVAGLIFSTSTIIAEYVEHVKDSNGMLTAKFVGDKVAKGIFLDNLKAFNNMVIKGQFESFLKIDSDQLTGKQASFIASGIILSVIAVIWIVRELVFSFFYMRDSISDYLLNLSYFVELNYQKLGDGQENIRGKQEKIAEKLVKLSDKIAVDSRISTKRGEDDIRNSNKDLDIDNLKDLDDSNLL